MRPLPTPSAVPNDLALVVPAHAYLEAYQAALKTGWSANTTRDTSGEELIDIQADPDRFLRSFIWHPGQMINLGAEKTRILADGWTVIATDLKPSAHYEHVVLVTDGEPEILTARGRMFPEGVANLNPRPVSELKP